MEYIHSVINDNVRKSDLVNLFILMDEREFSTLYISDGETHCEVMRNPMSSSAFFITIVHGDIRYFGPVDSPEASVEYLMKFFEGRKIGVYFGNLHEHLDNGVKPPGGLVYAFLKAPPSNQTMIGFIVSYVYGPDEIDETIVGVDNPFKNSRGYSKDNPETQENSLENLDRHLIQSRINYLLDQMNSLGFDDNSEELAKIKEELARLSAKLNSVLH